MSKARTMNSNRPYLLRALYEWINDNHMTPYLLIDASGVGVQVPASTIKDGRVVLNISVHAVAQLNIGQRDLRFLARFSGVSHSVIIPLSAVLAIYAQETGQGMMLPEEVGADSTDDHDFPPPTPTAEGGSKRGSHLRVVK